MTNAERIRLMNDEELWYWLDDLGNVCMCGYYSGDRARCDNYKSCRDCWLEWLKKEVDCNFDGPCDHANPTADKIQAMSDREFYNWLSAECTKFPVGDCSIYTDCLECWKEHLPLAGRAPVLIELFARRYCPPPLCPAGKRNKED